MNRLEKSIELIERERKKKINAFYKRRQSALTLLPLQIFVVTTKVRPEQRENFVGRFIDDYYSLQDVKFKLNIIRFEMKWNDRENNYIRIRMKLIEWRIARTKITESNVYGQIASVVPVDDLKSLHFLLYNNKPRTVLLWFMRRLLRYETYSNFTKDIKEREWGNVVCFGVLCVQKKHYVFYIVLLEFFFVALEFEFE